MQFVKMLMNEECDELRKSQEELKSDFDDLLDHLKTQLGNIRYDSEISKKIAKNELSAFEIAIKKEFNHKFCMSAHISKVLLQNFKLMMSEMDLLKSHNELLTAEIESLKTSNGILMAEIDLLKSTAKPVHCPVETSIESLKSDMDVLKNAMNTSTLNIIHALVDSCGNGGQTFYLKQPEDDLPGFINPMFNSIFDNCPILLNKPFYTGIRKHITGTNEYLVITKIGEPVYLKSHNYMDIQTKTVKPAYWDMVDMLVTGNCHGGARLHYAVETIPLNEISNA